MSMLDSIRAAARSCHDFIVRPPGSSPEAPLLSANEVKTAEFKFKFDLEDPMFAGHFPGHPILPGVFQLEMVRHGGCSVLNCRLAVREIRKAKFQRPIQPGQTIRMELKLTEEGPLIRARARFTVDNQPAGETVMYLCRDE